MIPVRPASPRARPLGRLLLQRLAGLLLWSVVPAIAAAPAASPFLPRSPPGPQGDPSRVLEPRGLKPFELGLVINDDDPLSRLSGAYYAERRGLPAENVIHVRFARRGPEMGPAEFLALEAEVARRTPNHVQALALAWTFPFRVGCMSMTSAFAFGYDTAFCASGCEPTQVSRYFDSDSDAPLRDYFFRPAMLLAGSSLREVQRLIDRGIAADGSLPAGTAYLVHSPDERRNVRAARYAEVRRQLGGRFVIREEDGPIRGKEDVMFYFIGLQGVPHIARNRFLPGAVADHLTSFGGLLADGPQMSILRWLEAGATGSFGTVVEPCNFADKFPDPLVLMRHYLGGETLIEAYWKSVRMPGQGLFVGEPLAAPFRVRAARLPSPVVAPARRP
ncbi:MAG TPA: TIGR03790 family protein [Gammaproteobacteria bacterium]|nr:TIGR03790 family protein [Gammaproteobacteria bacterium]